MSSATSTLYVIRSMMTIHHTTDSASVGKINTLLDRNYRSFIIDKYSIDIFTLIIIRIHCEIEF